MNNSFKIKDTCGPINYATCIIYEGILPVFSNLTQIGSTTIEEIVADMYLLLGDTKEETNVNILLQDSCLTYTLIEGKITTAQAIKTLDAELCDVKDRLDNISKYQLWDTPIDGCDIDLEGLVDPCGNQPSTFCELLKIMTPQTIPVATTTQQGIIEIATQAEVDAKSDFTRVVTPSTLGVFTLNPNNLPNATETNRGIAEIATQAEVNLGIDDNRIVTPLKLQQILNTTTPAVPTKTSDLINDGDAGTFIYVTTELKNKAVNLPYTIIAADLDTVLYTSGTGNLTVPSGLPTNFNCGVIQTDTGTVTIVGSGTTVNKPADLGNTIAGQHYQVYLRKAIPSETYNLIGNLTTL